MKTIRIALMVSIVVCCAATAMGQTVWQQHPDNPITEPGPSGTWEEGGHAVDTLILLVRSS